MNVKQLFDLNGRVALVTGGSRGLGLQMAEALGEMGARLAITARKKDELDEAVKHLKAQGLDATAWVCDLGKREQIAPVLEQILAKRGRVDILVNNAGATWGAPAEDHPLEAWDKLVNLNLTGTFVLSQLLAKKVMIPGKWGRIINIASVNGIQANDPRLVRTAAYVATKHGITVNAICPGFFPTKMTKATLGTELQFILDSTPTRRAGNDEDLKGVTALLASEAGRHITGQAIVVDGGATII